MVHSSLNISSPTPLTAWIGVNGYQRVRIINDDGIEVSNPVCRSHNLMSGGSFFIPDNVYLKFLSLYSSDLLSKQRDWLISELPVFKEYDVSRLFFDIDVIDSLEIPFQVILSYMKIIQNVLCQYFSQNTDYCKAVVCTTQSTSCKRDGIDMVKTGIHIIYPDLGVTLPQIYQIRHTIIYKLQEAYPRIYPQNAWDDIVDKAVYTSGLKMLGSFKIVPCHRCIEIKENRTKEDRELIASLQSKLIEIRRQIKVKRRDRFDITNLQLHNIVDQEFSDPDFFQTYNKYRDVAYKETCNLCNGCEKLKDDRCYQVKVVLRPDSTIINKSTRDLKGSLMMALEMTSIRVRVKLANSYEKPDNIPFYVPDVHVTYRTVGNFGITNPSYMSSDLCHQDYQGIQSWTRKSDITTQENIKLTQDFIRLRMGFYYKNVIVKDLTEIQIFRRSEESKEKDCDNNKLVIVKGAAASPSSYKRIAVRVMGEGSTFCTNKMDLHNSNTIYFWFTSDASCFQKCFSRKEEVRIGGCRCKDYKGPAVETTGYLHNHLFPQDLKKVANSSAGSLLNSNIAHSTMKRNHNKM